MCALFDAEMVKFEQALIQMLKRQVNEITKFGPTKHNSDAHVCRFFTLTTTFRDIMVSTFDNPKIETDTVENCKVALHFSSWLL